VSGASETTPRFGSIENWLQAHSGLTAAIGLFVGFLIRLHAASGTFLDPDEALHFWAANRTSVAAAYQGSLHLSHPPLLVFVLYFWQWLGTSEAMLRLPSVMAGTAFCWLAFKWLDGLFGRAPAWIGLIFLTFLPPLIALSSEVRQYALLLLFIAGAAYFLERALAENSTKLMVWSALSLYLAMLSHYSAFLFAATIGIYTVLRFVTHRSPAKMIATWLVGQLLGLGIAAFLYITHLSRLEELQGAHVPNWLPSVYLPNSYFHPGHGSRWLWALARTGSIFQYTFGQLVIGDVAFPLFIAGIILLLRKKIIAGKFKVDTRLLGFFFLLPFVLTCVAALTAKYPYGGTRHSAFLVMFAVAGVSVFLAKVTSQRLGHAVIIATLIVAACNASAWGHPPYSMRSEQSRVHMDEAIQFIRQQVSGDDVIFVNNQTSILLGHYLCEQKPFEFDRSIPNFHSFQCRGFRVLAGSEEFSYTADNFPQRWNGMVSKYSLKPGQKVWLVQMGSGVRIIPELQAKYPEFRNLKPQSFGQEISIFPLTVGAPIA
jgi:dolichyl-phosphate-mannose-protein mannosyltransferase